MNIPSQHPIMVMPMNGVSDIDLALAVDKAGAFPSISIFNYYENNNLDFNLLDKELQRFIDIAGHSHILISMHWEHLLNNKISNLLNKLDIKYIELFIRPLNHILWPQLQEKISQLRTCNFKFFFKTAKIIPISEYDAIIIKGPNGAGRSFASTPDLQITFETFTKNIDASKIIPSGGIGNNLEVQHYISKGAAAVGIGTLIAVSEESKISMETKKKIISSTSKDIVNIGPLNCRGLLFSKIDNDDDDNNSRALRAGIKGTDSGCIYVGNGIDYIKEILPVKEIIQRLLINVNQ